MESKVPEIKDNSYNEGWDATYDDDEIRIAYARKQSLKKGWDQALKAAGVPRESELFKKH